MFHILHVAIYGQSALVGFLAVLKDVLAYLTQIEVEVATQFLLVCTVLFFVEEWVHEPELDVLYVLCFEVGIVHLAHHAAPTCFGT